MTAQSAPVSPDTREVQGEFDAIIVAFNDDRPENLLALSQFLRRMADEVGRRVNSERALEARGQVSLTSKWCDPEE